MSTKVYYIKSIEWDTEDIYLEEDIKSLGLPSSFFIEAESEEELVDNISDEYGYCVEKLDYEVVNIPFLRKMVKEKRLCFDFSEEEDFNEDEEEAQIEVSNFFDISYSSRMSDCEIDYRAKFPDKKHNGSFVIEAPDVDTCIFKKNTIKFHSEDKIAVTDIGYHEGDIRLLSLKD